MSDKQYFIGLCIDVGTYKFIPLESGPAITIAGPYVKRIAWVPVWVGKRIITVN